MKNIIRLSSIILMLNGINLLAQIPNNGFENWTNFGHYENPNGWSTMNNATASSSLFTATKATPGNPGTSYLKLTSKLIGGSVVNGIAVSGQLDTLNLKGKSGFPYQMRPATFGGKWQHMIFGNSQGGINILLSKWNSTAMKRDTIATGGVTLSGMAMSWANFSFYMNYVDSLRYPDSCMIVLKASGSNPTNNDYLWLDNLAFTGSVAVVSPPPPNLVGLQDFNQQELRFNLKPNPSNELATILFDNPINSRITVSMFDINGKEIKDIEVTQNTDGIYLNIGHLSKGIYLVTVKTTEKTLTKRLVVE